MAKISGCRPADRARTLSSRQRCKRGALAVAFCPVPGLETALFYSLIMTRRAARLGLDRARNVERDDARDLARCALTNPGRDVCWSRRRRNAFGRRDCCCKPTAWYLEPWTRTSACQRLCKCSNGGNVQRRTVPGLVAIASHYAETFHTILSHASAL